MHPKIAAFAERLDLAPGAAVELDELVGQLLSPSLAPTVIGDIDSSRLGSTYVDEGVAEGVAAVEEPANAEWIAGRYEDLGSIGTGGMGEVRRVRDHKLNRILAMKILHASMRTRGSALHRFLDEARATAQLQHPNIVPVHDIGTLPDGRVWFTMKEVRGRTLAQVTAEVHAASDFRWNPSESGWTFKRLVAAFLAVCHATAYANERGVVHRDLKPENVMVGRHGETYVLDWGLVKLLRDRPTGVVSVDDVEADDEVMTGRVGALHTRVGTVAGTPAYMAPEQARGEVDRIDARTDVYALGAILYEILSGRSPYSGADAREVLAQVVAGPPRPVRGLASQATFGFDDDLGPMGIESPSLPDELVRVCERAMAREPAARFDSVTALADEVEGWLDGARRREQALEITERALGGVREAQQMLERANELQARGDALLESIEDWQEEGVKAPGWRLQDEATALRRAAELRQLEVDQGLAGALQLAPDLPEARGALAERYLERHAEAERLGDEDATARAQTLARLHAQALPELDPIRRGCARYLRGDGALSLRTDPPGAEVLLHRYELRNRRLVEVPVRSLGRTPLHEVSVPMGSYLLVFRHPERAEVRYPVEVPRLGHWHGRPPGATEPEPIWMPPRSYLGPDEVYIPAGWFHAGGDPLAPFGRARSRLWCDALVMARFPVTNRQYIQFLDWLVTQGRQEEALVCAPRERAGSANESGALNYLFDGERFALRPDPDGHMWQPEWPVLQVDWHGARAYLGWLAEREGKPWRLPGELEWEKSARGVDGRDFPWGEYLDPSWCRMSASHRGDRVPSEVGEYPTDVSVYGVRGMGGNSYDWCLNLYSDPNGSAKDRVQVPHPFLDVSPRERRAACGGGWSFLESQCRVAGRRRVQSIDRLSNLGFRGMYRPNPTG